MKSAIFLDRDGVIIKDNHLITKKSQVELINYIPEALYLLKKKAF